MRELHGTNTQDIVVADKRTRGKLRFVRDAWLYVLITIASVALGSLVVLRGSTGVNHFGNSDLTNFFLRSADYILKGDPFHMYSVRSVPPAVQFPNDSPPLSMFVEAPVLAISQSLGYADKARTEFISVALPFTLLMPILGFLVVRVITCLNPDLPKFYRLLGYAMVTLSPFTWVSLSPWGHIEQPLALCFLMGLALSLWSRREFLAGVFAGLAGLTAITDMFALIGLGIMLLASRQWKSFVRVGVVGALLFALGMLPFFLVDRHNFLYSFVLWRPIQSIGYSSIWSWFADNGAILPFQGDTRQSIARVARHLDVPAIILSAIIIAALSATIRKVGKNSPHFLGVMACSALAFTMFSKQMWPYYYLQPYILLIAWEFSTVRAGSRSWTSFPVLSLAFLLAPVVLSGYVGIMSIGWPDRILTGTLEFSTMLGLIVASWFRMRASASKLSHLA